MCARREDKKEREGEWETECGCTKVGVQEFTEGVVVDGEWSGKEWKKEDRLSLWLTFLHSESSQGLLY